MNETPTRAAALTPMIPAGIAVVGVIGPDAMTLLRRVFRPRTPPADGAWAADRLRLGQVVDGDEVIDDAIVAARTDRDGTGRVEFNVHGGPRVVQRLLLALRRHGATIVAAEDLAGDVWPAANRVEREVYELLPHAQTRRAAAWLLRQREALPAEIGRLRSLLRSDPEAARKRIADLTAGHAIAVRMLHGFSVAIVGPPNAGKSTLANALCGKPRVLVSEVPGTTRDYVSEPAAIEGVPVTLIDTAGIRSTADAIETEAIARARQQAARADLRLVILDGAAAGQEGLPGVAGEFEPDQPSLLVLNKSDLPGAAALERVPAAWASAAVRISAATGDGLDALRTRIVAALGVDAGFDRRPAAFTERQADLLRAAAADGAADTGHADEHLRSVLHAV